MLKERRKSVIEKGSLALSLFPSSQVRDETRKGEIERDRKRTRIGERKESERANGRTSGGERGGCCCCGRGITSAPLTRKTFRLNLVLDSARLRSTHPNRPAFLARPKRFADLHPSLPPTLSPSPSMLRKCYQAAAGPPPNHRHRVSDSISKLST